MQSDRLLLFKLFKLLLATPFDALESPVLPRAPRRDADRRLVVDAVPVLPNELLRAREVRDANVVDAVQAGEHPLPVVLALPGVLLRYKALKFYFF